MCGGKGGTSTQSQSSSVQIPQEVLQRYQDVNSKAADAANQPFQTYGGQFVAPLTGTQTAGIQQIEAAGGVYQPYTNAGLGALGQGVQNAGAAYGAAPGAASPYNQAAAGLIGGSIGAASPIGSQ